MITQDKRKTKMQCVFKWLVFLLILGCIQETQLRAADPVASWAFEEGSGTTTADSSGNGNTGTLQGTTAWSTAGHSGNALQFDGNDYVSVTDSTTVSVTGSLTISAWVNGSSFTSAHTIVSKNLNDSYRFRMSSGQLRLIINDGNGLETKAAAYSSGFSTGVWYHVAVTVDMSSTPHAVKFYVNGVQISSGLTTTKDSIADTTGPLLIGANSTSGNEGFIGLLDDVKIYSSALSASELYGSGNQPPSVEAGDPQSITWPTDTVNLDATVTDDGTFNVTWEKQYGLDTVTFGDVNAVDTTATFGSAGTYILRLTATDNDGATGSDLVTITVASSGGTTQYNTVEYWKNYYFLRSTGQDTSTIALTPITSFSNTYYVATNGNDNNNGSISAPFKTIGKAVSVVGFNDCVYLRGGVHEYSSTITIPNKYRTVDSNKDYLQTDYNYMFAYPGETPIIDFSNNPDSTDEGLILRDDFWHFRGITFRNSGSRGVVINGSYNIMENCSFHHNGHTGLSIYCSVVYGSTSPWDGLYYGPYPTWEWVYQTEGYYYYPRENKVINCDSYNNYDSDDRGQDADGFEVKAFQSGLLLPGEGMELIGCRSWSNSDDGFDYFRSEHPIFTLSCWSFANGINIWNATNFGGDGNGFKFGDNENTLNQTYSHIIMHSLGFGNGSNGFDENESEAGIILINNTGWDNEQEEDDGTYSGDFYFNVDLAKHTFINNLVIDPSEVTIKSESGNPLNPVLLTNSWQLNHTVTSSDFVDYLTISNAITAAKASRDSNGALPDADFITLSSNCLDLIEAGSVDAELGTEIYKGSMPCIGALCE